MALDARYILLQDLQEYFVNKDDGTPLAFGQVFFWVDDNRNEPKSVYQLTGAPPNYTYTPLPNPINLSAVGTPQDNNGNDVAIYYFPYDDFGNAQLYYISVFAQDEGPLGIPQFTREAWPNTPIGGISPATEGAGTPVNMLSNPQFVDVNFDPTQTLVISLNGTVNVPIAPGWNLLATSSAATTISVTRNSPTGNSKLATNPCYTLTIAPGANVTSLQLYQRLDNTPDVWSANSNNMFGYLASSISLGTNRSSIVMEYAPSNGTNQTILNVTNSTGTFATFNNTVQLLAADNTDNATTGYVDILLTLNNVAPTTLSSIQVIGMSTEQENVPYDQEAAARQRDHLSHYYKPLLAYKPIPSYLVGWDFPLNPAQVNGDTIAVQAIGANKSQYTWDQTIVFQSANSGVSVARGTNGSFQLTAAQVGQVAVVQYLDQTEARKLLNDRMSIHISGSTSRANGLAGKVTLWATTSANLPDVDAGTNNSLIVSLDATGFPTCGNGATWTQVTRNGLGDAYFSLSQPSATNSESADINLSGWDLMGAVPSNTATFFAIVIGFSAWAIADVVNINSVGLCSGDIATRPGPKTFAETLHDCQRYYWKTFSNETVPVTNVGVNTGYPLWQMVVPAGDNLLTVFFPTIMRAVPNVVLYNPVVANNSIRDFTGAGDCTSSNVNADITGKQIIVSGIRAAGSVGNILGVHITADARLGVVN